MVLPVVLVIMLALFDLGRAVYSTNTLAQASRSATRKAIVNQNETQVRKAATDAAATLGLNSTNVDVCFKKSASALRVSLSGGEASVSTICITPTPVGCLSASWFTSGMTSR